MKTIVYLPASALAVEPGVEPVAGDVVDLTGTARVEAIQNGRCRLVIEKLNDVEPESAPGTPGDDDGDESGDDEAMEAAATAADADEYR